MRVRVRVRVRVGVGVGVRVRPPLNLARYLVKLSRPAEAIGSFYAAAAANPEYFGEVKLGVGTAKAQQGRLGLATP